MRDLAAGLLKDTEWHQDAACHPSNYATVCSTWFLPTIDPDRRTVTRPQREQLAADRRAALNLCSACPVRKRCARYQRENGISYGVWGGRLVGSVNSKQTPKYMGDR